MAAPTYQDSVTESAVSAGTTTVALPAGASVGDLLLLSAAYNQTILSVENNGVPGDDWTLIRTDTGVGSIGNVGLTLWYRVMQPGDASVKVTWNTGTRYALSVIAYSGVDPSSPIEAHGASVSSVDGVTATAPSVTTTSPLCRIVECFGTIRWKTGPIIGPATIHTAEALFENFFGNAVSDQELAAAGASGTQTANVGSAGNPGDNPGAGWVAQTVALAPVPCVPPTNDDWTTAIPLLPASGGTIEGSLDCSTVGVWYQWTADVDGTGSFSFAGAPFSPFFSVFADDPFGAPIVSGTAYGGYVTLVNGTTYYLHITGTPNAGDFILEWSEIATPPPRNLLPRKAGRGRLGCGVNEAYLTWKCGTPRFCPLPTASEITWSRHLNDISEAQVVIPLSGDGTDTCCDCLGDVEPWCHELHIARDGKDVWLGPVTEIVYEFDKVTIRALDLLGWATVRVAEVDIDYTIATGAGPADWTTIGIAILDVAFVEDDPCLLPYLSTSLSGYVGEQKFLAYTDSAFDQLDALAGTGLEYTVVGRTVILASPNVPTTPIATLLDEHILGAVQLTKSGLLQADRWFVHFDKDDEAIPPGPGMAEAANQYCYGLLERIRSTDTALANVASADVVANVYVAAASVAPRLLEIPDGSQLSPEAPWTIDQMIPGCRVDVGITRLCVDATQSFILAGVNIRQTKDGEEVTVTLGPLNLPTGGL